METGQQTSPELSVGAVWGDAWEVYKLLFRRSVVIAAAVYVVIESVRLISGYSDAYGAKRSVVLVVRGIPWRVGAHWIDQPAVLYAVVVAASAVAAPFEAHVLSVIYYRITDPENRVIHPDVRSWQSVWEGA
jgi:hypothetical protein